MKHVLLTATNIVSIASALGCAERLYMDPQRAVPATVVEGHLRGDFGPRVGFDGDATEIDAVTDASLQTSRVIIAREQAQLGTAMVIIVTNGPTLDRFAPGTYEYENARDSMASPPVAMNVCSGDGPSSIDYDSPADRVTLTVEDAPQGRAFEFRTETIPLDTNQVQVSTTSFILATPSAAEPEADGT